MQNRLLQVVRVEGKVDQGELQRGHFSTVMADYKPCKVVCTVTIPRRALRNAAHMLDMIMANRLPYNSLHPLHSIHISS